MPKIKSKSSINKKQEINLDKNDDKNIINSNKTFDNEYELQLK
jgi:hypothetical protein